MTTDHDSGRGRSSVGQCTECGEVFAVEIKPDGEVHVLGTAGGCTCGNDTVVPVADE